MTAPMLLTPHQCDAVSFVVEHLSDGEQLTAIRGLAGTGKTSLIPSLRETITKALAFPTAVGSPTHRAAMILRNKGIVDAGTIHSLALTPYFQGDYAWAHRWLGEDCPARAGAIEERTPDVGGVPHLLARATDKPKGLMARVRRHGVKKVLASLGLHGKDYFDGFGARQGEGVLIVDEASMVGEETLKLCLEAFPQVVLIGDPGQLPPVKDHSRLAEVPGFDLTEVHRQAADNPIITLAYEAREGNPDWRHLPLMDGAIEQHLAIADPAVFLTAPLIVWRNETRLECTKGIRAALGFWHSKVMPGEPLVCRATSAADRAEGLINNSLWRVLEVSKQHPRRVTVEEDGGEGRVVDVLLHLEDIDGEEIDPEAVSFRFGYCLTAHTAQGGEWPTVYISKPDLLAHQAFCKRKQTDEHARWSYTAITRAKTTLAFVQEHRFLAREEPVTMPITFQVPDEPAANEAPRMAVAPRTPAPDVPDDIPEPVVPQALVDALNGHSVPAPVPADGQTLAMANGLAQYMTATLETLLSEAAVKLTRSADAAMSHMADFTKGVLATNEHAQYAFADALAKVTTVQTPYTVVVHAVTPSGLPCTFTMVKATSSELIEELTRMVGWLESSGYTAMHFPSLTAA